MDFAEGQRVRIKVKAERTFVPSEHPPWTGQPKRRVMRIKDKQIVGTIEKKLTSLEDVYVVLFGDASRQEEKLVRGADLEPAPGVENQKLA